MAHRNNVIFIRDIVSARAQYRRVSRQVIRQVAGVRVGICRQREILWAGCN